MDIDLLSTNVDHGRRCCERVGRVPWGLIGCPRCGGFTCFLHAAIWVDNSYRCFHCFSPAVCLVASGATVSIQNVARCGHRKALLVVDGFYVAGVPRHCIELLDVFLERGFACSVLSIEGGGRWADQFVSRAAWVVASRDASLDWTSLREMLGFDDFEFVSAHLGTAMDWTVKNAPSSIRAFAHLHSEPSEHEVIAHEWLRSVVDRFHRILVPSHATRERYEEMYVGTHSRHAAQKFRVLPNGVPRLDRPTIQAGANQGSATVGSHDHKTAQIAVVSRIDTDKFSIPLLVETAACLCRDRLPYEIRIAGDGECTDELMEALVTAGLSGAVTLLGFVDDVASLYEWADVVFLPSKREGMPYVLLESAAASRPLVAPAVGVFRDLEVPSVFTFAAGDAEGAAAAIKRAIAGHYRRANSPTRGLPAGLVRREQWSSLVAKAYGLN